MRYLVLSDIHANIVAFESVVEAAGKQSWDAVIFLGDLAGYGNALNECVELLSSLRPVVRLLGNHDALLLDSSPDSGSEHRRVDSIVDRVIRRHREQLTPASLKYIASFSDDFIGQEWQAVHGGLRRQWEYIDSLAQARLNAPELTRGICLFGHTHVPAGYAALMTGEGEMWRIVPLREGRLSYRLAPSVRAFFNPGSVGQPRDGVPLASYGIFDTDQRRIEVHRVAYDIGSVQQSMRADGYPEALIERLASGV